MAAVVPGGERQREMAYRFGVNWVMYALTGNYKTDQVHVPAIIDRLVNNMLSITFAPMFDWAFLGALGFAVISLAGLGVWRRARGTYWRLGAAALLLGAMINPVLVEQERVLNEDVVAIVVDESTSQRIGDRGARTEQAVQDLTERLGRLRGVMCGWSSRRAAENSKDPVDGTHLFDALKLALANVPRNRIGATFLITDGQVHDAPSQGEAYCPRTGSHSFDWRTK